MGTVSKQTRTNRTITIDFPHAATDVQRLDDGKAFLEWVLAFILSIVLPRCGLALPVNVLADEPHRHWLRGHVYRPTMVHGRVRWHLGDTEDASAAALTQSDQACPRVGLPHAPASRVRGILTDGFDSTTKRRRTLCPGARLGHCLRHALTKLPKQLTALASPVRTAL